MHCSIFLLLRISERRIKLILGDHDRRHTEPAQETLTIERVFIRPDFVKKTFNKDHDSSLKKSSFQVSIF